MSGEIKNFKHKIIGGFDQNDVIDYITDLAAQRNSYEEENGVLKTELDEIRQKLSQSETELQDALRQITEVKVTALSDASSALSDLEGKFDNVRSDMEVTVAHIKSELSKIGDTLSLMSSVLDTTGKRFSELHGIVDEEKSAISD